MILGIYGAGGLGREVLELAQIINKRESKWEDFIFVIDGESEGVVNGIKVYSYSEAIRIFSGVLEMTVGIGEPAVRERVFRKLEEDDIPIVTLIHPDVHIPDTTFVGKGVTIQYGNFISCNVIIEDYVFIQPHTTIGHDDVLKKGCTISAFCNLAGEVKIGSFTYLGISSCYKEGVSIGDYAIIGMGSVVYKHIADEMIAVGNPARTMVKNEERRVFNR